MPTLLNLAGAPVPENVDGIDLFRKLQEPPKEQLLFGNACNKHFAVIGVRFKYTWCRAGGTEQLFDLENDPMEQHELISAGEHTDIAQSMREQLIQFLERQQNPVVKGGRLNGTPAPNGPEDFDKWPGFISTQWSCDVLH